MHADILYTDLYCDRFGNKIIRLDLSDDEQIEKIGKAISDKVRRKIIKMSTEGSYSVMEIAERLNMPVSTVSFHLKILKEAGFIQILPNPTKRGNEKIISQYISLVRMDFRLFHEQKTNLKTLEIPLGSYSDFRVDPPCALADSTGLLIGWDKPEAFYSTKRFNAQLLSFTMRYEQRAFRAERGASQDTVYPAGEKSFAVY